MKDLEAYQEVYAILAKQTNHCSDKWKLETISKGKILLEERGVFFLGDLEALKDKFITLRKSGKMPRVLKCLQ